MEWLYENFQWFNGLGLRLEYLCIFIGIGAFPIQTMIKYAYPACPIKEGEFFHLNVKPEIYMTQASHNPNTFRKKTGCFYSVIHYHYR